MKIYWANFKKDKYFLTKSFLLQISYLLIACISLKYLKKPTLSFNYHPFYLIPLALVLGIKIPTIMHNSFHHNFSRGNTFIGHFCALFALMDLPIMCINHTFHHAFADSENDPHNPHDSSFFKYLMTSVFSGASIIENKFLEIHGGTKGHRCIFKFNIFLHYIGIPLRLFFWFQLLGVEIFCYLFLPTFIFYIFCFAHVNYITHARDESGKTIILNLNSNIWYRFVNYFGDGVYFHKNHHINPNLIDPRKLNKKRSYRYESSLAKI